MPRVFIIGPGSHDYAPAARYGTLVPVLDARVNPFNTDELLHQVEEVFEIERAAADDYLLLGGSPVLNAIAAALVAVRFGRVRCLIYGARDRDYVPRDIQIPSQPGGGLVRRSLLPQHESGQASAVPAPRALASPDIAPGVAGDGPQPPRPPERLLTRGT